MPTFGKMQSSKKGPSRIQRIGMKLKLSGKLIRPDLLRAFMALIDPGWIPVLLSLAE